MNVSPMSGERPSASRSSSFRDDLQLPVLVHIRLSDLREILSDLALIAGGLAGNPVRFEELGRA
jgi:hypothetical protein